MIIIRHYLNLIKPGIVSGNLMSAVSGFLMASQGHVNYITLIYMIIGISLVIASSCVLNNIIDRDIDSIMHRTKTRALVQNTISIRKSIYYSIILYILGFFSLGCIKNFLIILLALSGYLIYIVIYSLWMKRKSIYGIIIGSISGAMPPVIGYCTVTNKLDTGALLLLIIFSLWQIPHSYSIGIFRNNDYKIASIPTFIAKNGIESAKTHINIYILGFSIAILGLTIKHHTSYIFLYIMTMMNLFWLYTGLFSYNSVNDNIKWSKKMFYLSIIIITLFNLFLSLDSFLFSHYKYNVISLKNTTIITL